MKKKLRLVESTELVHPDFKAFMIENDGDTIIFKSNLNTSTTAMKLAKLNPNKYWYPEKPEYLEIKVGKGGYAVLPHAFYTVHTLDGKPAKYTIKSQKDL